jgi:hypothetical protein
LINVTFNGNSAIYGGGGGIANDGSSPALTSIIFSGNSAAYGGGMYNNMSSPILTNVVFSANSAVSDGGGMFNDTSDPILTSITFIGNLADYGGAMLNDGSSPILTNITFKDNAADTSGGAMFNDASAPKVRNSILWGNTAIDGAQIYDDNGSLPIVNTSVIEGGYAGGANIITANPLFGAPSDYGGYSQTIPLLPDSPAIDATSNNCPAADQRGMPRSTPNCDIGAFESQGFTLTKLGGDNQSALLNAAFVNPLVLSVTANNALEPVDGGRITFTPPTSGASAVITGSPATIAGGAVSVSAVANDTAGGYHVVASAAGATKTNFALENIAPEMDVIGNNFSIADGDTAPVLANDTDFGGVDVKGGGAVSHIFTIRNIGTSDLTLNGTPKISISGAGATDFTVTDQPVSLLAPGASSAFTIRFNPSVFGPSAATVSIANNDSDENPYNFAIQGRGTIAPEMNVRGNGASIVDGDATPSVSNDTDFGSADISGGTVIHIFTIENTGSADLTLDSFPRVSVSGAGAANFSVTAQPSSPVAPDGSTTFTVRFTPSVLGVSSASVSIDNNDSNENPYDFTIQGIGTRIAPEVNVRGNGASIANGDATPSVSDDTDFGSVNITAGVTVNHTFTIENTGSADLTLDGFPQVSVSGANAVDFSVTAQPASTIAPGGSTTFTVRFAPASVGMRAATISIANNDADENPYSFDIKGAATTITVTGNLIVNGGFNAYSGTSRIPVKWKAIHFDGADGKDSRIRREGKASVRINARPGISKVLMQAPINLTGVAGDKFTLSFFVKGSRIAASGVCQVRVSLYDGKKLLSTNYISCPAGTYKFRKKTLTFSAPSAYTRAVVRISYRKEIGTVWLDGMSLIMETLLR